MTDPAELETLFHRALALPDTTARTAFLNSLRATDSALAEEVASLIEAHEACDAFLEESAVAEAAALIPERLGSSLVGSTIGAWRIDSLIDSGGMGSVFRATRIGKEFTQTGALKLVRVGFETEELIQRFARERRLLASMEHPRIARLLDGGTSDEGLPWLVMEYVDGLPVDAWADHHRLTVAARLELFEQLADAVAYLHQNLITHRDLKCANVLVDVSGHLRVLDFGIASLLDGSGSTTVTSDRRLSFATAAPEQVCGGAISTATDVYALGMVLHQLLVGEAPYTLSQDMTAGEREAMICERVPPRASERLMTSPRRDAIAGSRRTSARQLAADMRGDLDTILATCLQKEPSRRYASVAELRADLARYRDNRPIVARADTTAYRTRKFIRRHWRGLAATAATMSALTLGLALAVLQAEEARVQRDRALAMNRFMQDVLTEADPYEAGTDRTVREALTIASARLDGAFPDQPYLEAALRQSVGGVQLSLLDLEAAERNLLRALALLDGAVPADDETALRARAYLAWLEMERENYAASIAAYQAVIDRLSAQHSVEFRAMLHNDLGVVLNDSERFEEAAIHLQRALQLAPDAPTRVSTLINLGLAADGIGQLEEAASYYREAIAMLRARGEAGRVADLAHALNNYGNVLSQQGDDAEALRYYLESLDVRRHVFGLRSAATGSQQLNIGRLLLDMNRPQAALPHLEEALAILPVFRDEDSIYMRVTRASHARAVDLTTDSAEERRVAIATLAEVARAFEANDDQRSSRFAVQTSRWLREAQQRIAAGHPAPPDR